MVAFYSQEDQDIYEKNKFMPQSKYLLNAPTFNTPTVEEEKITETFGIPDTNAFTNSGGGGGGGSSYGLPGNFQQVVDARQRNLNKPIDTSTFMGKVKDFMNPQSAEDIRTSGYQDPRFQPGIIGTMMGKLDNYRNLPQADQAFIAENMGYTGPTIFGENNSGLGKDEFGINTRSLFGNYAQHSRDMADEEGDLAKQVADQIKRGLTNTIQMRKLAFHQKKQEKENTRIEEKTEEARAAKESEIVARKGQAYYDRAVETAAGRDPSQGNTVTGYGTSGLGRNPEDQMAKGGRAGYFFGGRARLQGGGMSQGKEANIDQSTNMGGGASGDYSTMEQNMNHREAMRNNQRETPSTLNNTIDTGSELNYLNNLKNLNLPGLALGFGFNKIRNYLGNKKDEDDKLSALPTNNYMADLNAAQIKQLEGPQKMGKEYGNFSDQDILDNITPFGDEETAPATLKDVQTFYGSNGGRVNFKNGGLAGIL